MKSNYILEGTKVVIDSNDSWVNGEWGIVKSFDGQNYHVALWDGPDVLIFGEEDLKVSRA